MIARYDPRVPPGYPDMVQPSAASTAAFVAIVATLVVAFVLAVSHASRHRGDAPARVRRNTAIAAAGIALWLAATAAVSASGALAPGPTPPPLMLFFGTCVLVTLALALSPVGRTLAHHLPLAALVGIQAFRLPLELVLHAWYEQGVLPIQMTYEGHNFDILSGLGGLVFGLALQSGWVGRGSAWAYNLIGLALLLAVMTIAVTSSPVPLRRYMSDPPVLLAFYVPYVWIMPVCVCGALFAHVLTFRRLLAGRG